MTACLLMRISVLQRSDEQRIVSLNFVSTLFSCFGTRTGLKSSLVQSDRAESTFIKFAFELFWY